MGAHAVRRRRLGLVLTGAVAVSAAACGSAGEPEQTTSSTSRAPLETTTTTEPSASASTGPAEEAPSLPSPGDLVDDARNTMTVASSVTVTGSLHLEVEGEEDRTEVRVRAEGSAGKDGSSRTTFETPDGGRAEMRVINLDHYLKVNAKWAEERSWGWKQQRLAGRWLKLPPEGSPLDAYRPQDLVGDNFSGLTPTDFEHSIVTADRVDGEWTFRVDLADVGNEGGGGPQQVVWISTGPSPKVVRGTTGRHPHRSTLTYTKWGSSPEDVSAPSGAKGVDRGTIDPV